MDDTLIALQMPSRTLPQRSVVITITEYLWQILFPEHHRSPSGDSPNTLLADCQHNLQTQITRTGHQNAAQITTDFLKSLPTIQKLLLKDAGAAVERDPAASGIDEIILCYPGFLALMTYRLAHELDRCGVTLIPRMMTEHAHAITGCDIHPKALIGEGMFIDHATGVVIGQTSVIGNHVTLFQGVTLGSLAIKQDSTSKRHPTLENNVVIYANATILGGETVIGAGSVIGGSCWITSSVPPHSKVILAKPQMNVSTNKKIESIPNWDI